MGQCRTGIHVCVITFGGVTVRAGTAARACSAGAGVCPVVHPIQRGAVDLSRVHRLSLVQQDRVHATGLHGPFTVAPHPWAGAEISTGSVRSRDRRGRRVDDCGMQFAFGASRGRRRDAIRVRGQFISPA